MRRILSLLTIAVCVACVTAPAVAITESDTGMEYPDAIAFDCGGEELALVATGTGVREKTFLKVDVYTIVGYVLEGTTVGEADDFMVTLDVPKRIRMDLRRSFSREKLVKAFTDVIDKNYDSQDAFSEDLDTFLTYFTADAQDGDVLVFDYCPGTGMTTTLNGDMKGTLGQPMAEALWTVWFGRKPASGGLKKDLLSALEG
ncbi:MAG: hypothetical protein GY838_10725 [bacterium]|nr:hypothetical protein [bacterium]